MAWRGRTRMGSSLFFLPLVSIYLVRESKESRVDTSQDGGPVEFVQDVLREAPYDKQTAIMRAVARKRRVSRYPQKCVNSQAVYPLSEQHGLEAQERRYTAHEEGKH